MVQMKGKFTRIVSLLFTNFISHMVQMKVRYIFNVNTVNILYIPHGSDESHILMSLDETTVVFISHMVQMKVIIALLTISIVLFFISHMVQMKVDNLAKSIKDALNFISHMVQMKDQQSLQFIRHGSYFISHMVQMKA